MTNSDFTLPLAQVTADALGQLPGTVAQAYGLRGWGNDDREKIVGVHVTKQIDGELHTFRIDFTKTRQ